MTEVSNESDTHKSHPRWTAMWESGLQPGDKFDALKPLPALVKMVEEGSVPTGRALVPGCGRGYDVVLLATPERQATGLDIAPLAIAAAEEFYSNLPDDKKPPRESVSFQTTSFFDMPEDEDNKFQFIYDYTFFCALDPSIRQQWGEKMAALVSTGGELCTIMFPIGEKEGGPPFKVSIEDYKSILEPLGFEAFQLEMLPAELCHEGRDGKTPMPGLSGGLMTTAIGRWRKK